MISNCAFPLVRAVMAQGYNQSFLASAGHLIGPEQVTFEWVGTTTDYPCTEQDLATAEVFIGANPQYATLFNDHDLGGAGVPAQLGTPVYAYLESLGLN